MKNLDSSKIGSNPRKGWVGYRSVWDWYFVKLRSLAKSWDQAYDCLIHFYKRDCYDVMTYEVMSYDVMRTSKKDDLKIEADIQNEDNIKMEDNLNEEDHFKKKDHMKN